MADFENGDAESSASNVSLTDAMKDSVFMTSDFEDKTVSKLESQISDRHEKFRVYDVIIIGAGISGLTAAYYLKKQCKNINILILEAKDRVGGRTLTVDLKCSKNGETRKWDMGGQWVTDTQTFVTALLNELNIETFKQFDEGINVLEINGKTQRYNSDIPNVSLASLIDLHMLMRSMNRNCRDLSIMNPFMNIEQAKDIDRYNANDFLYKYSFTDTAKSIIDVAIGNLFGLEASQLNALFTLIYTKSAGSIEALALADEGCGQEKRVKGGTQQISEKLLDLILSDGYNNDGSPKSKILLNRSVVEINQQQNDRVHITVINEKTKEREIYSGLKVISSIPINRYINVNFMPILPLYKRNVFESCKIGNYMKILVTYRTAFWRNNGYSGMVVCDGSIINEKFDINNPYRPTKGPLTVVYDATTDDGEPALVCFCSADRLVQWSDMDAVLRKNEIINSLIRFFGPSASDYVHYYEKNWNLEPFNGGCPACNVISSGIMKDYYRAACEPFINIHFAGTETATQWIGYMNGAVESGIRTANEVLHDLYKDESDVIVDYEKTYYYQQEQITKQINNSKSSCSFSPLKYIKFTLKYGLLLSLPIFLIFKFKKNGFRLKCTN